MKKYGLHPGTIVKFVIEKDGTRLNGGQVRIIPLATTEEIVDFWERVV